MALTAAQVRGRIKNVAKKNHADPRDLLRIYAMETSGITTMNKIA